MLIISICKDFVHFSDHIASQHFYCSPERGSARGLRNRVRHYNSQTFFFLFCVFFRSLLSQPSDATKSHTTGPLRSKTKSFAAVVAHSKQWRSKHIILPWLVPAINPLPNCHHQVCPVINLLDTVFSPPRGRIPFSLFLLEGELHPPYVWEEIFPGCLVHYYIEGWKGV